MSWPSFWVNKKWQSIALWPLSKLVCWEANRRYLQFLESPSSARQTSATVVVVGNLVVGGTGKTPFIVWLVSELKKQGYNVALLSRGYGAKNAQWPCLVNAQTHPKDAGDEPVMLAQQTGCLVAVSPKRVEALQLLNQQEKFDFIISDDGLQHFALARDIEVVMIDAERQFGNGFCLPAGPLREPLKRIARVDYSVWNGLSLETEIPELGYLQKSPYRMLLQPLKFHSLTDTELTLTPDEFVKRYAKVYAIAGIGNPQRFFNTLEGLGLDVISQPFADHHDFTDSDFNDLVKDATKPLVMTQKDAVKCAQLDNSAENWWYLEVAPQCDSQLVNSIVDKHLLRLAKQ